MKTTHSSPGPVFLVGGKIICHQDFCKKQLNQTKSKTIFSVSC